MYHWNLTNNMFTPGQFVKARASVLAISPDGKYVVYYAEALSKRVQSYVAVSHLPYFSAHAFFLQFHCAVRCAKFHSPDLLEIWTMDHDRDYIEGRELIQERIEPGCPFEIRRQEWTDSKGNKLPPNLVDTTEATDTRTKRLYRCEGLDLVGYGRSGERVGVIATFPKEQFEGIVSPAWAQKW